MKLLKILMVALAVFFSTTASAWTTDSRFPAFEVDGTKFMLTWYEGDMGDVNAVLLFWTGNAWNSWGGTSDVTGIIDDNVSDERIMAKGSLHGYLTWLTDEAMKRAKIKAALPLPDPTNRLARFKYNLMMSVTSDGETLRVKPAPLP